MGNIKKSAPRVISLFAGCGGLDLGFHQQGYEVVWANDFNEWAAATYKHNLGDVMYCGDIEKIDPNKNKNIPACDLILGGFPCQDFSMIWKHPGFNGERVTRILDWLVLTKGSPKVITSDNGTEFAGIALDRWAYNNNVRIDFIKPGKPIQNAFIESFNGRLRHECLNQHYFVTLTEAKKIIESWRMEYNTFRPHGSLNGRTPAEFKKAWEEQNTPKTQPTNCVV